ncbi:MAG: DUF3795 domain-containing protein [Clostridia bacterium]|nr:DUF3795 domain-containing protein [Clostridia bacterium]
MKWYKNKLKELKNAQPIISVCGDDCAVCPRYIAKTEEELRETAEFWYKVGWRDHVVSNEEIACTGCGCRPTCSFMILPCQKDKAVSDCKCCEDYCCDKITQMLQNSDIKESQCKAACESYEEYMMLKRAFYEKRENLGLM